MARTDVERVRSFNRLVTQRVGALNDQYLARDLPLGQARLLWEIGRSGCEVRRLRSRLGLDSGYLSRLLRALEMAGLVHVDSSNDDGRIREAHLTAAGRAERDLLDKRSDALARSFLAPLSDARRERLVAAMAEVELLLTASLVDIRAADPAEPEAQFCLAEYFAELDRRFDAGFDPQLSIPAELHELRPPAGVFLIARLQDEPIGCVGLRLHGAGPAEVKRMWVAQRARGLGVGRRLLTELEEHARAKGVRRLRLETNRSLSEAIGLYGSAGYREVEAFNEEPYAHHWFEKRLRSSPGPVRSRPR